MPEEHSRGYPTLDEPRLLASFLDAPDPTGWEEQAGILHRLVTENERRLNNWEPGTHLVVPETPLIGGVEGQALAIPTLGGLLHLRLVPDAHPEPFQGTLQYIDGPAVEVETLVYTYDLHEAESDALLGRMHLTPEGGFYAFASLEGVRHEILGPNPLWHVDSLGGAVLRSDDVIRVSLLRDDDGLPPVVVPTSHCNFSGVPLIDQQLHDACILIGIDPACSDGIDNDGDRWVDYPDDPGCDSADDNSEANIRTSVDMALSGEGKWCTDQGTTNWAATMSSMGDQIETSHDLHGTTVANVFHIHSTCWFAASASDALTCDSGTTCSDGDGHSYTYGGCDGGSECYRDNGWDDIDHFRLHTSIAPLKGVQVIHLGDMTYPPASTLCGLASFPTYSTHYSSSLDGPLPTGDSVTSGDPQTSGCPAAKVPAHEVGHNYNAEHGLYDTVGGCRTVMSTQSSGHCVPAFFSDPNRAKVNECIIDESSICPRSGTG